jgi:hypothetical protein
MTCLIISYATGKFSEFVDSNTLYMLNLFRNGSYLGDNLYRLFLGSCNL